MSSPYIGEIRAVGFTFPPVGWYTCNGQSVSISEEEALYTLIGTTYGGDGSTYFNVPNLCGRASPGTQGGPGLTNYPLGAQGGQENVTLGGNNLPIHQHSFSSPIAAINGGGTPTNNPTGAQPGPSTSGFYNGQPTPNAALAAEAVTGSAQSAGGSQPHANLQPVLALNYIICAQGIYPPRPQ